MHSSEASRAAEAAALSAAGRGRIFLTVHREESFMRKALSLGGAGYVLKDFAVTDILAAIRAVSEGLPFISPAMTTYLIKAKSSPGKDSLESLTPAERRVLRLVAQYKTTQEIAETLCVSPRTIEFSSGNDYSKTWITG